MGHRLRDVELVRSVVAQPDVRDLALVAQGDHRAPVVLDRGLVVGRPVHLQEVKALHLQAPQAVLDLLTHPLRGAGGEGLAVGIATHPALGEDVGTVGVRVRRQRTRDDLLGMAPAVDRCGVDPVDAELEGAVDRGDRRIVVLGSPAPAPRATGSPRTKPDPGDVHARTSERDGPQVRVHAVSSPSRSLDVGMVERGVSRRSQ